MKGIQEMAAMVALNNMFKQGHFSICTIDNVAKMLNVNPKGKVYDVLHTLHCIDFSVMPSELKDAVPGMIRECLELDPIYEFDFLKSEKKLVDVYVSPIGKLLNYVKG